MRGITLPAAQLSVIAIRDILRGGCGQSNKNKQSKLACTLVPCRACRLNGANKFAAHINYFTNVCLSEHVREKVKFHILVILVSRLYDLQAHLFGCLSWL